jgi:EAL domain-containing protein (putative c-di-GMP-specific phosphodiesterase class I)
MNLGYDLGFDIGAFVLFAFCLVIASRWHMGSRKERQHRTYLELMVISLVVCLFNIALDLIPAEGPEALDGVRILLKTMYLALQGLECFVSVHLIFRVNGTGVGMSKYRKLLLAVPLVLEWSLLIVNLQTGMLFHLQNGTFLYGEKIRLVFACHGLYLIIAAVNTIRHREIIPGRVFDAVLTALMLVAVSSGLTLNYESHYGEMLLAAVAALVLLLWVENDDTQYDQNLQIRNEAAFIDRVRQMIALKKRFCCISIHITNFDSVLRLLSEHEQQMLNEELVRWITYDMTPKKGAVYRYYGEWLEIVLEEDQCVMMDELIAGIRARMKDNWHVGKHELSLRVVVLPIRFPDDCKSVEDIKGLIRNECIRTDQSVIVLGAEQKEKLNRMVQVEQCIRRVLITGNINIVYQPIWDSKTNRICACEALLRVDDPVLGSVSPVELIPVAERNGTIAQLDRLVFKKVCSFLNQKQPQQYDLEYVEVNLSLYDLLFPDMVNSLRALMNMYGVSPSQINIEFTETYGNVRSVNLEKAKKELMDMGFTFSLDDFGTEFSNMSRLFENEFRNIKIDKSLLWDSENNKETRRLLQDLIQVICRMGLQVLQEGVETKEQLDFVVENGCRLIQGYYFSKPLAPNEFIDYVKTFNEGVVLPPEKPASISAFSVQPSAIPTPMMQPEG